MVTELKIENGKLKIVVLPSAMIPIVGEAGTLIFNFQLSIFH